jgi:hypothetical protein
MLGRVALVRTDDSEELSASFIRETSIDELATKLAVTGSRRTLRRNTKRASVASYSQRCYWSIDSYHPDEGGAQILHSSSNIARNGVHDGSITDLPQS